MIDPEETVIVNGLVRQALVSAREILGENGLNAVINSVGLERFNGAASFHYGVQEQVVFQEKPEQEVVSRFPVPAHRRHMLDLVTDTLQEGGGAAPVHTLDMDLSLVDHSSFLLNNFGKWAFVCPHTLISDSLS